MGGFSRTTIDCLIASGVFPRLSVIGPWAVAWSQQELEDWITSKRQTACNADGWPAISALSSESGARPAMTYTWSSRSAPS